MNYFDPETASERYAKGRPDFHGNTLKHIEAFLIPIKKFNKALDIACGTGLSAKALLTIATEVYGTDTSLQMLRRAALKDKIHYAVAPAESQPFADMEFDLITVCSGVHWFAIDAFLKEANRLLKPGAWLVLYDNFFLGKMDSEPDFKNWFEGVYLKKFPAPARQNTYDWSNTNLNEKKFNFIKEEEFKNAITFTKSQLVLYFTTQSNIIAAVENGSTSYEEAEYWLDKELGAFFNDDNIRRVIQYGNWIKYIQKNK